MKILKTVVAGALLAGILAAPLIGYADDTKKEKKTYPLNTCVVSGEKLGGDMGDPYVFTQNGHEVRLCCKSCLKDFKRDPAKYLKKLDEAEAKAKK
jgi:hypothetical protein